MGNQMVSFLNPAGAYQVQSLPTHPSGYQGQIAQRSQLARTNAQGELEFFIVDGDIFDKDGVRIADNYGVDCEQCVPTGCTKVLAIPVPAATPGELRCGLFYIVTAHPAIADEDGGVYVGLLDLNKENPNVPGRRGRLLNIPSDLVGAGYQEFIPFFASLSSPLGGSSMWRLPTAQYNDISNWVEIAAADPKWETGPNAGNFLLHAAFIDMVVQWRVKPFSFQQNWSLNQNMNIPDEDSWSHGSQFGYSVLSDQLVYAVTQSGSWSTIQGPDPWGYNPIMVLTLEDGTGSILYKYGLNGGLAASTSTQHIHAVGFSPDANWLLFSRSGTGINLGCTSPYTNSPIDLATLPNLNIGNAAGRIYTRIEPNVSTNGEPSAVFFAHAQGVSALIMPGPAPAMWSWVDDISVTQPIATIPVANSGWADPTPPRLLNGQMLNAPYLQVQSPRCCAIADLIDAPAGETHITGSSNTWAPGNNGLPGDPQEGAFIDNLVVDPGATLTVNNMTLRFGPDAKLIVKPGGYARFNNCTLTGSGCEAARWPGARVEGNTYVDQLPMINGDQGYLYLYNTTVSNARTGVLCGREYPNGALYPSGYGGIVRTYGATFKNCVVGADVRRYTAHLTAGSPDNLSEFKYTDFITDQDWPDDLLPTWHAQVIQTRKVNFFFCDFENSALDLFPQDQWGGGVRFASGDGLVKGTGQATNGTMKGLRYGVHRGGSALLAVTVDNMRMENNVTGIYDGGGHFGRYTSNQFTVPDQGTAPTVRTGIYLRQSRYFTVERNTFTGGAQRQGSAGIFFKGLLSSALSWNYDQERIYDNTFLNLQAGCLVNDVHRSADGTNDDTGLQILCNDYTNNVQDIAMGPHSIIMPVQGEPLDFEPQLAGNRFYGAADCVNEYDWLLDDNWNQGVGVYNGMVITYPHHEDPLCEATCPDPVLDDFIDDEIEFSGSFNKSQHCADGVLDVGHLAPQAEAAYADALSLCAGAKAMLDGTTDGGERPDLIAELQQEDPWLSTGFLRDRLMLNSPLSNTVLRAMILRGQPMDQWHITQVAVANSPLDPGMLNLLRGSGILNEFFTNVVMQAQTGQGPSTKQLLQQEWMLRRGQLSRALAVVGWHWATDTINPGGEDSLRAVFGHHAGLEHGWSRLALALDEADATAAANAVESFQRDQSGYEQAQQAVDMLLAHNGDWSLLDSTEVDSIDAFAHGNEQVAAYFAGLLSTLDHGEYLPDPVFPVKTKRMLWETGTNDVSSATEAITSYPTPADEEAMLVYPADWKGLPYRVEDAQGKVIGEGRLEGAGLHRLVTSIWPPGVYGLTVVGGGTGRLLVKH